MARLEHWSKEAEAPVPQQAGDSHDAAIDVDVDGLDTTERRGYEFVQDLLKVISALSCES